MYKNPKILKFKNSLVFENCPNFNLNKSMVGMGGIEPPASVLSGQRSTTELHAQTVYF